MNKRSLVSITDYSKEDILEVLKIASEFEKNPNRNLLEGKVVASLFFEPLVEWEVVLSDFPMLHPLVRQKGNH